MIIFPGWLSHDLLKDSFSCLTNFPRIFSHIFTLCRRWSISSYMRGKLDMTHLAWAHCTRNTNRAKRLFRFCKILLLNFSKSTKTDNFRDQFLTKFSLDLWIFLDFVLQISLALLKHLNIFCFENTFLWWFVHVEWPWTISTRASN